MYNYICGVNARNCSSGCCSSSSPYDPYDSCAQAEYECYGQYSDYPSNPLYHYQYFDNRFCRKNDSRNCASGCCDFAGGCSYQESACVYKYADFDTNPNYHFLIYNQNCNNQSRNRTSGCCAVDGACAYEQQYCLYKYSDYGKNTSYYYPAIPPTVYNPNCDLQARNCSSGCCKSDKRCADFEKDCQYKYSDFNTNPNYIFSVQQSNQASKLSYAPGSKCYDLYRDSLIFSFQIYIGTFVIYLLLVLVVVLYCYCKRQPWVEGMDSLDARNNPEPNPQNPLLNPDRIESNQENIRENEDHARKNKNNILLNQEIVYSQNLNQTATILQLNQRIS